MIKATVIFGQDAIDKYDVTGKVPTDKWINRNGGVVHEVKFKTRAEYNAYAQALNDVDGWYESLILPLKVTRNTNCPRCTYWRTFFADRTVLTYCPECGQIIINEHPVSEDK